MKELNKQLSGLCGIYIITNLENGNRYIGSSIDLYERLKRHFYELNNNCHSNSHLQNAWNKYQENNFDYGILELCHEDNRLERESFYINTITPEYNINGVNLDSVLKHTEETKKKISEGVKESYRRGKLKKYIENTYAQKYDCYVYSIIDWKLLGYFPTLYEASVYMGQSRFDLRTEYIGNRLFKGQYVVLREKIDNEVDLKNKVTPTLLKYVSKNLKESKYLICEKDGQRFYFRSVQSLVDFIGCSSRSTILKHTEATIENPYIVRNTNIKIYWSETYIPYESRSEEESSELLLGKNGEGCDATAVVNSEIAKGSESPYSVESE